MLRRLALLVLLLAPASDARAGEPVPFQECSYGWIPWAATVEDARVTAKREGRLLLAFVFPWDATVYEAGYAGAERVRSRPPTVSAAEADAQKSRDPGFAKEQGVFAALLGDPHLSALVARAFVPVRLRMHTWHFFEGGPGPFPDPLPMLGTSDRKTRPPALVVATADGKLVHRVERMGVFDARLVHVMLLTLLEKNARFRPDRPKADVPFRQAIHDLAAGGDLEEARRRLLAPPTSDVAWAAVTRARLDFFEGKIAECEAALRGLPPSADRDGLLADELLRRGRCDEAAAVALAADDADGRVALARALERLGKAEEAGRLWKKVLDAEPEGPRGARARLHLATDGPSAREWDASSAVTGDPMAETTIKGAGGEAAAVRYLLAQQDPDGSWKDSRGPAGPNDLSVPRTALCACALRAWDKEAAEPRMADAIARGVAYVQRFSEAPQDLIWHVTYALHLELELLAEKPTEEGRRRALTLLRSVTRMEHDGGFTYMAPPRLHTFNAAPILLLLVRARDLGLPVEASQIERTAKFLERNRVGKSRVFHYGPTLEHMSGEKGKTDEKSTCMRSSVCELALFAAGAEKSTKGVSEALDIFFAREGAARSTQKVFESYVDVTSLQDSYRYFFGSWYAARAVLALPEGKRKKPAARLSEILRSAQEVDGSFVDSQMVGKSSSTALALLALAELRAVPP